MNPQQRTRHDVTDTSQTPGFPAGRLARQGLALPRTLATTAHAGALYPFSLDTGTGHQGILLGHDLGTGAGFYFDILTAYDTGRIQGPNMIISGAGAYGKSAIIKSLIHRSRRLTTAGRPRIISVIDPKGEWVPLAHALGWSVLRLRPGGPTTVNPLDITPPPTTSQPTDPRSAFGVFSDGDAVLSQRVAVTVALLAQALQQPHLSVTDHRLVRAALAHLTPPGAPVPTLNHLRGLLAAPPAALADDLDTTPDDLLERRRTLLDACAVLVEDDLYGICDGPTNVDLDWNTTPGVVLDLSALLSQRRTLRMVLTAAVGWLTGVMYHQPHRHKITVIDEGWAALDDLAVIRFLQDQWRLGRQWGTANILITHALTDLTSQTDTGTAQTKIAQGLLTTTSIRVYLHQNPENTHHLYTDMGLNHTQTSLLNHLTPFQALWQIGTETALVHHIIAPTEWPYMNTDTAMRGS